MKISNMTLVKIASIGGIATVSMGLLVKNKINENVRKTEYYKEALSIIRSHRGAVHLLGEPIKDCKIEVGDESRNYTKGNNAKYEVPLKGSKQRGMLYFWAEKNSEEKWTVKRIELELTNDKSRRFLIKPLESIK